MARKRTRLLLADADFEEAVHDHAAVFARWAANPPDPARVERVAEKLARAWARVPDLRLGQFMVNVTGVSDPFYVDDADLEARLDAFIETGEFPAQGG